MSLLDVDQAVTELDRVLAAGARILHLRPSHLYGKSPADPSLDPFWARVEEARVPVALHTSWSAYHECVSTLWGEHADPRFNELAPLQWYLGIGARPIMDTLAAMVFHNLFGRFPDLRVISVEHGSTWVAHLLEALDHSFLLGRGGRQLGGELTDEPSAILKEHFAVAPYPEEDVESLAGLLGAEHVLFGSDYPHPEGLERPREYVERVAPLGHHATERIMGLNAWELLVSTP
jgi:predicted TIM-barrel fold metal-dependent hydrolase